jgi:hypothetical protein
MIALAHSHSLSCAIAYGADETIRNMRPKARFQTNETRKDSTGRNSCGRHQTESCNVVFAGWSL